jgi:hypothetical protein
MVVYDETDDGDCKLTRLRGRNRSDNGLYGLLLLSLFMYQNLSVGNSLQNVCFSLAYAFYTFDDDIYINM